MAHWWPSADLDDAYVIHALTRLADAGPFAAAPGDLRAPIGGIQFPLAIGVTPFLLPLLMQIGFLRRRSGPG